MNFIDPRGLEEVPVDEYVYCTALGGDYVPKSLCDLANGRGGLPPSQQPSYPDVQNRGQALAAAAMSPSIKPGAPSYRIKDAAMRSVALLDNGKCLQKITGTSDIFVARARIGATVNGMTFHEGTDDKGMNLAGWPYSISFEEYHRLFPSHAASVLLDGNNRLTGHVVLWADFFGNPSNPTSYLDQLSTLIHEITHVHLGKGDEQMANYFGFSRQPGQSYSQAFQAWLDSGCPDPARGSRR